MRKPFRYLAWLLLVLLVLLPTLLLAQTGDGYNPDLEHNKRRWLHFQRGWHLQPGWHGRPAGRGRTFRRGYTLGSGAVQHRVYLPLVMKNYP